MRFIKASMFLGLSALTKLVIANVTNYNPTGAGCVDPKAYLSCYSDNADRATACISKCNANFGSANDDNDDGASLQECVLACGNVQLAANIACWLTDCWNQPYSCAYQATVLDYIDGVDAVPTSVSLPFWPAPEDGPGRCVCNLAEVVGNYSNYGLSVGRPCPSYVSDTAEVLAGCECCYESSIFSNLYEICPHNDLSLTGIGDILDSLLGAYNETASDGCSVLADGASACQATYSIDTAATTFYNPGVLPSGFPGTEPLSDLGGSITSPLLGATYTFSVFPAYTSTIIAAAYNAKNAAATASFAASGTIGGVATAAAASTGTVAAASSSSGTESMATTSAATQTSASDSTATTPANAATTTKSSGASPASRGQNALAVLCIAAALGMNGLP